MAKGVLWKRGLFEGPFLETHGDSGGPRLWKSAKRVLPFSRHSRGETIDAFRF